MSQSPYSRREFLHFMGRTSIMVGGTSLLLSEIACSTKTAQARLPFKSLKPTLKDDFVLAQGFESKILIKWNDSINSKEVFGTNNDFLAFTAFKNKKDEGMLWVNHEDLNVCLFHNKTPDYKRTREDVKKEQAAIGGSLLHIRKINGEWQLVKNSKYNRRVSGQTIIPFQKGYTIMGSTKALGTIANCAGGTTSWDTILTCEENYDHFYGEAIFENKTRTFLEHPIMRWTEHFPLPPEHYGWVVEVNPFTGKAVKRIALGRFPHEGAKFQLSKNGIPVVYMGEDRPGGFIYKFVSSQKNSLEKGTLYVANTEKGLWIPLDIQKTKILSSYFNNQLEVLTYTHLAAEVAGGTPQDRPEDIEIDPVDGTVFIALTNNLIKKNPYGCLLKLKESNNDYESLTFTSECWKHGGVKNGFASPDNMVFDKLGNLWLTTDLDDGEFRKGTYKGLGNNGLFYIPLRGPYAGEIYQVASAPIEAEFTGPMFSEDFQTLFLSVQHPGEYTRDPKKPTSQWPDGPGKAPKSAVVMISGPALDALMRA